MTCSLLLITSLFVVTGSTLHGAESLRIRLDTPLSSYVSHPGTEVRATVIAPWTQEGRVLIPAHSNLHGVLRDVGKVGLGFRRERAHLEIVFDHYQLPDGREFPLTATLITVDNAREMVTGSGRIKGILAADNPQGFIHGVWLRPSPVLFGRSITGLTGAAGRIWTEFDLGPFGAGALFAARLAMFRLPEPEIHLPTGTEMRLRVDAMPATAPAFPTLAPEPIPQNWANVLAPLPFTITKAKGLPVADIINLAFIGSTEELQEAFRQSGWVEADVRSRAAFARAYRAYTAGSPYPNAPVSTLLYEDTEPEFVFQKSLNTLAKRHHIRIWSAGEIDGRQLWVGAATQDIGVVFQSRTFTTTHKIDLRIDRERTKVVNDFLFTGCVTSPRFLDRPDAVRRGDTLTGVITDGRLGVLELKSCTDTLGADHDSPAPVSGPLAARLARRATLETRHYLIRGNVYHWGVRALRMSRARNQDTDPESELEY